MNLLMISGDRSLPAGKAGPFLQTLKGLSGTFDRIDILCPRVASVVRHPELPANVTFFASSESLLGQPRFIVEKGAALHAEHHYGVMTVHEYPPFYNGLGARSLHQKTGIPFVLEVHHVVGWPVAADFKEWIGRLLSRFYLPWAAKRAAAVRVVNRTAATLLAQWGVAKEKIRIVPSFYLDSAILSPASAKPTVDVAFCARLVSNKGIDAFLKAMKLLPDASAVIIGDGPMRASAEQYVQKHGMQDRVRFTGWLPAPADVINAMKSTKVFVMCSKSEGGPRVLLEAMACGIPVIATQVGIVPELINGENGLLTTGEPADIAAKVRSLLLDDGWRVEIGKTARAAVLPRFDKETTLPAYAAFLQSLSV